MKPLTIKDLLKACQEEIKAGHGDYAIMLSNDDEGNGYHYCWYKFITAKEIAEDDVCGIMDMYVDTDIAPLEKTIILG